jgi:hypothetical protein
MEAESEPEPDVDAVACCVSLRQELEARESKPEVRSRELN